LDPGRALAVICRVALRAVKAHRDDRLLGIFVNVTGNHFAVGAEMVAARGRSLIRQAV